ncbi:hypothetical protein [Nocardia caishijiensis]|uniref:PE family protein n=1 Tax=Nocardia caishijiensis TaxID=184756 RepID=A0ABQ6YQA7_9NOCA|nr:hypothetical protein [Nocardia caishijiensis]KAF0847959.1 hypothetical protein FNL39_102100 [Nocardia caishijiensis]
MAEANETAKEFQRLAGEAAGGRLIIEHDAAERCAKWCDDYITELDALSQRAKSMVFVDSFGDLNSAAELGDKFFQLAQGGPGSGSYTEAIRQHQEILKAMADMYRKAGAAFQACDEASQQAIKQQTNKLD